MNASPTHSDHPRNPAQPPFARKGFSLVELLAVICIMSLMAAIGTPAVVSQFRSTGLNQAGNALADLAALARQSALSKNVITALVLAEKPSSAGKKQGAVILEFDPLTVSWKQSGGWVRFPETVEAFDIAPDSAAAARYASLPPKLGDTSLDNCSVLVFLPDGRIDSPSGTRRLNVVFAEGASANHYDLVFNAETAGFRIVRF